MLLQTFRFRGDFIEALGIGYAGKAEPRRRRGEKEREKEKYFLLIASNPIDAVLHSVICTFHILSALEMGFSWCWHMVRVLI